VIDRATRWFDERLGMSRFARKSLDKVFPDNWSFMLGEVALYSLLVLIATGTYLTFFFTPGDKEVVYKGSYVPLRGIHMSEAMSSTVHLSWDVRAGLLVRQMHHWAALVFLGAIVLHLCRIFFTGAFRRPRELNWFVGLTLLLLGLANGFTGYSLPDDLLSGTGLRIAYSIVLAIPLVGTWLAFLVFGGEFPAPDILNRLFVLHVLLIPGLIVALLGAHMAILWHQKHTQFPGPGRREDNIQGSRLWPRYALRSVGLLAGVTAVIALLGGLVQINPIWLYGPFRAPAVTTAAQPDWYVGWLEGALRLFPGWRIELFGHTVSELFWPGVVLPGLTFALLYAWPFLEARFTHDHLEHHLLDRPRDRPVRTTLGVATLTFYAVLFVAGSQDLIAQHTHVGLSVLTNVLRVTLFAAPVVLGAITWKVCHDLQGADEVERARREVREQHGIPRPRRQPPPRPEGERPPPLLARVVGWVLVAASALGRAVRRGRPST
jgi:ubiquinol-cytochrome c reductase cytochrome b subunit